VSVSGADHRIRFDWAAASRAWSAQAGPVALSLLRSHAPFRTGQLRQSIARRDEPSPGRYWVVLFSTVPQARFTVAGTRAHKITARNGKALRWTDRLGNASFARSVNHPGTRPDPWPERALSGRGAVFAGMFAAAAREAMLP
jgi:hypothetical protein